MPLSTEQVEHIARLARIELSAAETEAARIRLDRIFELIGQMQEADTTGVEPMSHPQENTARLRADTVADAGQPALFQRIAPQAEAGLYLVPKVIE